MDVFADDKSADYAEIRSEDISIYEIERNQVTLGNILGVGQFGDVFRGTFRDKDRVLIHVAIKTCKLEREEELAEKLLEEAGIMEQFDHEHIIRFYGVCSTQPVWIIMELAEFGEMRKFLKENKDKLTVYQLILYCHQLSIAMHYLESKHFVHRDIAARNVLVSSWSCVKLADFGLSRWLDENNYYKASKSVKLPIKWMAPESINYRKFTTASDIWMFAVCMWEILTFGEKPLPGVNNSEVVQLLESGVRLSQPIECPSSLYDIMCECWHFKSEQRPGSAEVESRIRGIIQNENQLQEGGWPKHEIIRGQQHFGRISSDIDAEFPPQKPAHPLGRRHIGFVDQTSSNLDEESSQPQPDFSRLQIRLPSSKSANTLLNPMDRANSNRSTEDFYRRPTIRLQNNCLFDISDVNKSHMLSSEDKPQPQKQSQIDGSWLKVTMENNAGTKEQEEDREWEKRLNNIILERSNDEVYAATVSVVGAITEMIKTGDGNNNSCDSNSNQLIQLYSSMTLNIGVKLKSLITSADKVIGNLLMDSKNQIVMATNVLNSDMASLAHRMKLAQQFSNTVLSKDYQKAMLQASHALAVDSRNLLDAVDNARKKQIYLERYHKQKEKEHVQS